MGIKIIGLGVIVLYGAMLADVLAHGTQAQGLVNAIGNLWSSSVRTVAGQ